MRTALTALLLPLFLYGCATMGGGDPTAGLQNPEVRSRQVSGGDLIEEYYVAGQLRVVVTAKGRAENANIFVAGKPQGTSPTTLTLTAGPHQVRVELAGYRTVERWAVVVAGTSTNLRVFLEKA